MYMGWVTFKFNDLSETRWHSGKSVGLSSVIAGSNPSDVGKIFPFKFGSFTVEK